MFGKRNYNWTGRSGLYHYLRTSSLNIEWRNKIFDKFNYRCVDCGDDIGGNLNAHHKKPFKQLILSFLEKYNQFSIAEDYETLIRLTYSYEPFWNIENGVCLCEECHKKIHSKVGGA